MGFVLALGNQGNDEASLAVVSRYNLALDSLVRGDGRTRDLPILERARKSALRHVLKTFFEGSPANAMAALLELEDLELSAEDYDRLAARIERARGEGR